MAEKKFKINYGLMEALARIKVAKKRKIELEWTPGQKWEVDDTQVFDMLRLEILNQRWQAKLTGITT